jgi:hypothetical protein
MKLLFIFTLSLFTTPFALSQSKIYTVGVEGIPFLPYSNYENKNYTGILKEISEEFAKKEGIQFKYIPLPITRLYSNFYSGKIDFKLPANKLWQPDVKMKKNLNIIYSDPIVEFIDGVMIKPQSQNKPLKNIGIVAGFTPWEYLGAIKQGKLKTKENPSILGLLQQGLLSRVDGIYINIAVGNYYLDNKLKKSGGLELAKNQPHTKSTYHMATIKHPKILKSFNLFLKSKNTKVEKIRKQILEKIK